MGSRLALALFAAAGLLSSPRDIAAADARFPSHEVGIHLTLAGSGRATVDEEYALTAPAPGAVLQFLADPCASVGPLAVSVDGRSAALEPEQVRGPWRSIQVHDDVSAAVWRIHYEVTTRGSEAAIPVVMPDAVLDTAPGTRGARVRLDLRWTGTSGSARVAMPRLDPESSGDTWAATMLAMPSMIRVDVPPLAGSCNVDLSPTGGLGWRFAVFVLTMAVWVPAYLVWFGKRWPAGS